MVTMNSFVDKICCKKDDESSGDELWDEDAVGLTHVGEAVHKVLARHHSHYHHKMWNVTSGKVVGSIHQTPMNVWGCCKDPKENNDDWFPEKMGEIIGRTERWCDIMSLGPPDGKFMTEFKAAIEKLAERSKTAEDTIIVRLLVGNIVGMPVNCSAVLNALTKDVAKDANMQVWVGAWRKGFSWNHAKLIAVDGVYLHTGGHNLWDQHYLKNNPVHDLSIELEGSVARDGHRFANLQWEFIEHNQKTLIGYCVDKMPDSMPTVLKTRVTVSEWPKGVANTFPPMFTKQKVPKAANSSLTLDKGVPMITVGRLGTMVHKHRSADDAIIAMINSSQKVIRLVLQDIGPVTIPGTKQALPGLKWPKAYLSAIGEAIYQRGVDIEMVLSNPNSIPGGLKGTEANYGNGWSCVDVAAEIIKSIKKKHSDVDDGKLRAMVIDNLRICFLRHDKNCNYKDGKTMALHSKHFIVDDVSTYIGSQNLYMCDLAEWGVIIDSEAEVKKIKEEYFDPMWKDSYTGEDVDVENVMDGLKIDRDGEQTWLDYIRQNDAQHMTPHGPTEYLCVDKGEMGAAAVGFSVVKDEAPQNEGDKTEIEKGETPTPASSKEDDPEDDPESSPEKASPEESSPAKASPEEASPEMAPENTTKTDDNEEVVNQDPSCGAFCGMGDSFMNPTRKVVV